MIKTVFSHEWTDYKVIENTFLKRNLEEYEEKIINKLLKKKEVTSKEDENNKPYKRTKAF